MKNRAIKFAAIGALAGFVVSWSASLDFVHSSWLGALARESIPPLFLWALFRPFLENRPHQRLLGMIALYAMAPTALALVTVVALGSIGILGSPLPFMGNPSPMPEVTTAVFMLLGIAMPVIQVVFFPKLLGIPSPKQATLRLMGWALLFGVGPLVLRIIQPSFGSTGFAWLHYLGIRIDMIALFVVLVPDHIVMERADRARKLPLSCEKCAYDLTGNVSGVCPECGTALSESVRKKLF